MRKRKRLWLFGALTALLTAAVAIVVIARMQPVTPWWVIGVFAAPWFAVSIALRVRPKQWGWEGKYVDLWSVPHFLTGVLFALFGIGIVFVIAIAIAWEVVEVFSREREHTANRVVDVVLAVAGWAIVNALWGGAFALS